jgi:hypothetical protein
MKNQYFGDQTDYIKYGMLRSLAECGAQLGVHWTLTDDDGSSDGSRTRYLKAPSDWRHYDPEIFDAICQRVDFGDRRLQLVEELSFVPNAIYSFDKWELSPDGRLKSIRDLLNRLPQNSIVFLDPDNGLEVASARKGKPGSSKYVFLDEVLPFWQSGHSIIIYQHYPRVQRVPYVQQQLARLKSVLPGMHDAALLTSHVAFLACIAEQHREIVTNAFVGISQRWSPHVGTIDLSGEVRWPSPKSNSQDPRQQELPL